MFQNAIQDEKCIVRLQVFRMVLCGIPRSGKTFWKWLAITSLHKKPQNKHKSHDVVVCLNGLLAIAISMQ